VDSSCELGNEPSGSIKMLRIYRVAAQLAASRVVLSSTELVKLVRDTTGMDSFNSLKTVVIDICVYVFRKETL
jgi:hypothetical protein